MNLFLMPMWFLSGALFPPSAAWPPLRWLMYANPLTYGLAALRELMSPSAARLSLMFPVSLTVTCAFAVVLFALATFITHRPTAADLQ